MERKDKPIKGFLTILGVLALSIPLILIPFVSILFFTVAPFYAGYRGGKYLSKKKSILLGMLAGAIWSLLIILIIYIIVSSIFGPFFKYEPIGLGLILLIILCNIVFSTCGAFVGACERMREDEYIDKYTDTDTHTANSIKNN